MSLVQDNLLKLSLRVSATTKSGKRFGSATNNGIAIASSSGTTPIVITTSVAHGLATGAFVTIYGHATNIAANNTVANPYWTIIVTAPTTFSLTGSVYTAAGSNTGIVTPFMIGSIDGARLLRQRILDIYNEARFALFSALRETKDPKEFSRYVSGTFTNAAITFSVSGSYVVATKPTGFIELVSMVDAGSNPIYVLENQQIQEVRNGNPDFVLSATNLYAFDAGTQFKIPSASYGAGAGVIDYYGITAWTWITDVLPNTTVESFSPDIEPILIELACALANEQSNADVLALAKTLLNKKG